MIKRAGQRWVAVDGDQRAAAFAYYLLLSLLPLALLLVAAGSLFVEREVATEAVIKMVNHYTPLTGEQEREAVATVHEWMNTRGQISLTALPLLIWGAMKYLRTLIRTTNRIWQAKTYSWWRLPLKSLGLLGITASAVLLGILLPALAGLAGRWLSHHLDFFSLGPGPDHASYPGSRSVLRVDHDLPAGPEPADPVFRSLARSAVRGGVDLAGGKALPRLRDEPRQFRRALRHPGRLRGIPAVDVPLELRLRVGHLPECGAGGNPGQRPPTAQLPPRLMAPAPSGLF